MLSCSIWFCAPSFWMGGGLESCCVCRVWGADIDVLLTVRLSIILVTDQLNAQILVLL